MNPSLNTQQKADFGAEAWLGKNTSHTARQAWEAVVTPCDSRPLAAADGLRHRAPRRAIHTPSPAIVDEVMIRQQNALQSLGVRAELLPTCIVRRAVHNGNLSTAGKREARMRYLHTMVRVTNLEQSLDFYCSKLGMKEVRRVSNEAGRYTLVFLAANEDEATGTDARSPLVELTYNWDPEVYTGGRSFGHLAYEVDDIYALCDRLMKAGVTINRPPRDGRMAFVRSPDNISLELLQKGEPKPKAEPWASMPNTGVW
jgi:lactoylglutathione lyase